MILGNDFIILGFILILCLLPLYIYREKIFSIKYKKDDNFELFLNDLKLYMSNHHPKIKFDYSIVKKTENEKNPKLRKAIIIENIVEQFFNFSYSKKTQKSVDKEKIWTSYDEKSISNSKFPNDWIQRKELAYIRENKCCNRCGDVIINVNEASTSFVKDIKDGGGYNFENIIILCSDCNKILTITNEKNALHSLVLNDKLLAFVR